MKNCFNQYYPIYPFLFPPDNILKSLTCDNLRGYRKKLFHKMDHKLWNYDTFHLNLGFI